MAEMSDGPSPEEFVAKFREGRCPACDGPLGGFPPESLCAGVRCLSCGHVWVVTTNLNPRVPECDKTEYDVWVLWPEGDRQRVITAVVDLLGTDVQTAGEIIDANWPVKIAVKAPQVQKLARLFKESGFGFRTAPEFPWPME
jgi:hypothetical protein